MIVISVCVTDIPKDAIKLSEKNGKKYVSFVVDERKSPDNFGNTHSVAINQSKEDREAKVAKVYVGSGKEHNFTKKVDTSYEQLPDEDPFA
jgi:hypothetical protein